MSKKLAIIGSRGIPAKYGGFETFAEEFSVRLASRGYEVYVSCEEGILPEYRGVKLMYSPVRPFYRTVFENLYDMYFLLKFMGFCDYVLVLGIGSAPLFFIPRLLGKKVIINPDGLEWRRAKFNLLQKAILYFDDLCAIAFATRVVADAEAIKKYIGLKRKKGVHYIPYGVEEPKAVPWDPAMLRELPRADAAGLRPGDYYLIVARLEPENNIHTIVEGYIRSNSKKPLVIVGNYSNKNYRSAVDGIIDKYGAGGHILQVGPVYGKDRLGMLRQNCFAYFHGHSVGGTNPSLLEAMASGCIVVAHDNEFNREVGGDSLVYFNSADGLAGEISSIEADAGRYLKMKGDSRARAISKYSWDRIVDEYEALFGSM